MQMQNALKTMEKENAKYTSKEIITIAITWLFALLVLYVVYIKMRTFF